MIEQTNLSAPNTPEQNSIIAPPPVAENAQGEIPVLPPDSPTPADINAKPKSKKKLIAAAATTILLLILVTVGIFAYQKLTKVAGETKEGITQNSPTPSPQTTADEMHDWNTYSGAGYSFKYPTDFEAPQEAIEDGWQGVSLVMFGEAQKASGRTQTELSDGLAIKILTSTNEYASAKDAAEEYYKSDQNSAESVSGSVSEVQEITVGGKTAYYYEVHGFGDARMYFIDLGGSVLRVTILYAGTEEDIKNYLSLADQILSTLEFDNSKDVEENAYYIPNDWIAHNYYDVSLTVYTPADWDTSIEAFPSVPSHLIRFWKTSDPNIVPIQLDIKDNWDNTGNAEDYARNFEISRGIIAAKVDPPKKDQQTLKRYQTNYYFEYANKVYVFTCVHNWETVTVNTCEDILKYLQFN